MKADAKSTLVDLAEFVQARLLGNSLASSCLFIGMVLLLPQASLMGQQLIWGATSGGVDADFTETLKLDSEGNVYTTGSFIGTADFDPGVGVSNLTTGGAPNTFITKLSPEGDLLWARALVSSDSNVGIALDLDSQGDLYLVGTFSGSVDMGSNPTATILTSNGGSDVYLAKLDSDGNLLWASSFGGADTDFVSGASLDATDNLYLCGTFEGTTDLDPGPGTLNVSALGLVDLWYSKIDSLGALVWGRRVGGGSLEFPFDLSVSASGEVLSTGSFQGVVDFDPGVGNLNLTSNGFSDIFILKLDAMGDALWARSYGSTSNESGREIEVDPSGNVYVAGSFRQTVDFDPGPGVANLSAIGGRDYFTLKLDANGDFGWVNRFGGSIDEGIRGMTVDGCGNVYTCGWFRGVVDFDPGSPVLNFTAGPEPSGFIKKLSPVGALIWAETFVGTEDLRFWAVDTDSLGHVYVSGRFRGTVDAAPGPATLNLSSNGSFDSIVLKLSQGDPIPAVTTITVDCDPMTGSITCSPNPANICQGGCVQWVVSPNCGSVTLSAPGLLSISTISPGATSPPMSTAAAGIYTASLSTTLPGLPSTTGSCELRVVRALVIQNGSPVDRVPLTNSSTLLLDACGPKDSSYVAALSSTCLPTGTAIPPFIPNLALDLLDPLFTLTFPINQIPQYAMGLQGQVGVQRIRLMAPPLPMGSPVIPIYLQVMTLSPTALTGLSPKVQLDIVP